MTPHMRTFWHNRSTLYAAYGWLMIVLFFLNLMALSFPPIQQCKLMWLLWLLCVCYSTPMLWQHERRATLQQWVHRRCAYPMISMQWLRLSLVHTFGWCAVAMMVAWLNHWPQWATQVILLSAYLTPSIVALNLLTSSLSIALKNKQNLLIIMNIPLTSPLIILALGFMSHPLQHALQHTTFALTTLAHCVLIPSALFCTPHALKHH